MPPEKPKIPFSFNGIIRWDVEKLKPNHQPGATVHRTTIEWPVLSRGSLRMTDNKINKYIK